MLTSKSKPCGDCHRCCEGYLWGSAYGHQFSTGKPCGWLGPRGCLIYPNHPRDPCQTFECGWKKETSWPASLRPDHSDIVFVKRTLGEFVYWHGVRCRRSPSEQTLLWLRDYHRSSGQDFLVDRDQNTLVLYSQNPQLVDLVRERSPSHQVIWQS